MQTGNNDETNLIIFEINGKKSIHKGINATILKKLFCNENHWLKSADLNFQELQCETELITFVDIFPKLNGVSN